MTAATQRPVVVPKDRSTPTGRRTAQVASERRGRTSYLILVALTIVVLLAPPVHG